MEHLVVEKHDFGKFFLKRKTLHRGAVGTSLILFPNFITALAAFRNHAAAVDLNDAVVRGIDQPDIIHHKFESADQVISAHAGQHAARSKKFLHYIIGGNHAGFPFQGDQLARHLRIVLGVRRIPDGLHHALIPLGRLPM